MDMKNPMVVAAARVLCERSAEQWNVDAEDSWKLYGEDYLADAAAALAAAGVGDLLEALEEAAQETRHPDYDWPLWLSRKVSAVLERVTGDA